MWRRKEHSINCAAQTEMHHHGDSQQKRRYAAAQITAKNQIWPFRGIKSIGYRPTTALLRAINRRYSEKRSRYLPDP